MPRYPLSALLLFLSLCSCKDNEIRTYKVATDPEPQDMGDAHDTGDGHDHAAHSFAVTWQALPGWKQEEAGQFLTAAYTVPEAGRVTVSKLSGDGGGLAANINRWRGQVDLKPLPENEIAGQPMAIPGSGERLFLFNLNPDKGEPDAEGIFAAVLPMESETWYFKFTGPGDKLIASGGAFMDFLGSVRVAGGKAAPPAAPATAGVPEIEVTAPDGWEASEGSSMRVASFAITGEGGATADVSVIPLPGDSGSVLENVNRWRGQIQLPPLASADDPALGTKKDGPAGEFFISHMTSTEAVADGKKAAISTAILKAGGITWFFKITGEASLVEANREKFEAFALSATFP
jgi:hypothetical protein